jgi:hypothetical protein
MAELRQVGDLFIKDDPGFRRKEWLFERIGWAVMALILLAALLGLLGPGPLSNATAGEEGGALWVNYQRFAHRSAPTTLEIHAGPGTAQDGRLRLWISRAVVGQNEVRSLQPQPEQASAVGDRFVYTFNVDDPGQEAVVFLHLEPHNYFRQQVALGVEGGPEVRFTQVLYP